MLVTDELLNELYSIYFEFVRLHQTDPNKFIKRNRKKLRILIDTITEQLVESYFHAKPRNIPTAALMINRHKQQLTDRDDIKLFDSLSDVLQHYEILADKTYIDHKPKLEPLFRREIRQLSLNIALHNKLVNNAHAVRLRMFLDGH